MANQIKYGVKFDVDTKSLNQLKSSLQQIKKVSLDDIMKFNNTSLSSAEKILKSIQEDANKVESALNKAFNTKLNTLNLQTFNRELAAAQTSIDKVYQSFSQGGVVGQTLFNNFSREILHTNAQLQQSSKLLDDMAVSMGNTIKWGITSSIFNNITGSIQKAYYYAKDLDRSLTDIRIVTGDSADQMQRFAKVANTAAGDLGRSTLDYTKAALTFYQQGLSQQDVQARTEATLKAENITGIGEQMADYLTAVWNGFNVGAQDAEKYVDKLAAVADSTASNMGQLATGISKVASAANNVGVNIDQLTGQIATVIATTRQAPESVGVAFRTIYARINDIKAGTDEAQISLGNYSGKMAALGFNVLDATGHLRDTGQVIEEIGERWQSLTKEQQINLAQVMAGQRQYSNLISLFDNWDKYLQSVNTSLNSQGTLNEKNGRYLESLEAHMQQLSTEAERTYDILFDESVVKGFVDVFDGVLKGFNNFISGIGGGVPVLVTFGSTVANIFNKQIADAITSAQERFDVFLNNKNMDSFKNQIADTILSQRISKGDYDSNYQEAAVEAAKKQAEIYQQIYQVKKGLTQESYNELTALQQQIGVRTQQISLIENYQSVMDEVSGHEYTTYSQILGLIEQQTNAVNNQKQSVKEVVEEARQYIETIQNGYTPYIENEQALMRIESLSHSTLLTEEERTRAAEIYNNMLNNEIIKDEDIKFLSQALSKQLQYQNTLLDKANQAKSLYNKHMSGEVDSLKAQNAEAEKLVQNGVQRAKNAINLRTTIQNITSGLTAITTTLGAINTLTNETTTGAEKVNAAWAGVQGTLPAIAGIIGNTLVPGSGIFVTTITHGVVALGKQIFKLTGLWQDAENFFKSTAQRAKELNDSLNKVGQNDRTKNAQISSLEALVDEYQRLSEKAGNYGVNLDNLTKEQQDRYHDITNTFTEYNDAVIAGYDEQGNAIVRGQDALRQTIEVLRQAKLQADKAALGDKNTFLRNVSDVYTNDTNHKRLDALNEEAKEVNIKLNPQQLGDPTIFGNLPSLFMPKFAEIYNDYVNNELQEVDKLSDQQNTLLSEEFQNKYADLQNRLEEGIDTTNTELVQECLKDAAYLRDTLRAATGDKSLFSEDVFDALFFYLVPDREALEKRLKEIEEQQEKVKEDIANATFSPGTAHALIQGLQIYDNDTWRVIEDSLKEMGLGTEGFIEKLSNYITGTKVSDITVEDLYANIQTQAEQYADLLMKYGGAIDRSIQQATEDAKSIFDNKDQTTTELNEAIVKSIQENILDNSTIQDLLRDTENPQYKEFLENLISNVYNLDDFLLKIDEQGNITIDKIKTEGARLKQELISTLSETLVDSVDFDEFGKRIITKGASADQISNFLDQFTDEQIKAVANAIDKEKIVFNDFNTFKDYVNEFLNNVQGTVEQQEAVAANYDRILSTGKKIAEGKTLTHKETSNLAKDLGISSEQLAQYRANGTQLQQIINAIKRTYDEGSDERVNAVATLFPSFEKLHAAHQQQIIDANDVRDAWNDVYLNEVDALGISEQALESYAKARGQAFETKEDKQAVIDLYKREQQWDKLGDSVEKAKDKLKEFTSEQDAVQDTQARTYLEELQYILHNLGLDVDYQWIIDNLIKIGEAAKGSLLPVDELDSVIRSMSNAPSAQDISKETTQQYSNYQDIKDAARGDKTISPQQYQDLDAPIQEFFRITGDGTYKLKEDATGFYNAINNLEIQSFEQGLQKIQQQIEGFNTLAESDINYNDVSQNAFDKDAMSGQISTDYNLVDQQLEYLDAVTASDDALSQQIETWKQLAENQNLSETQLQKITEEVLKAGDQTQNLSQKTQEAQEEYAKLAEQMADAMEAMDLENVDSDVDLDTLQALKDLIQQTATSSDDLANSLEEDEKAARNVAEEILRFDDAIQDVVKNYDDWMDALNSGSIQDQASVMAELSDAYGDLLNLDGSTLSDSFLTSADNLDLMKAAIDGDIDAYNQLLAAAGQDIIAHLDLDDTNFYNELNTVQASMDAMNFQQLEIGASLNDAGFLDELSNLVNAAGMTADQATSYLASMGVDAEVTETTTDDTESNEVAAYTGEAIPVTGTVHFPTVSASSTEDGYVVESGQPIDDTWQYDELKVTPDNETIDAKKQNKAFALKVTSANKSSGGGFKYSQARNGGGSGGAARRSGGGGGGRKGGGGGKKGGGGGKGKKGSGSGSKKQKQLKEKQKKEKHDDQVDIYHDVNKQLSNIERALGRLQKKQDKLWGKQLLDNLNKQSALLEQHKQKLQEKLALQQKDLANKRKDLELLGATFDEYGNISNYIELVSKKQQILNKLIEKYNKLVEKYNKATSEKKREDLEKRIQKFEKEIKDAEKQLDDLEDKIKDYDALQEDMADVQEQIEDDIQQQIQINIKKFRMSIEIRLEMGEAERDWNKFVREVMHHTDVIKDSPFDQIFQDAKQHLDDVMSYFDVHGAGSTLTALADQMYATKDQIEQIDATGWASIYGDNNGTAMQDLQGDLDTLMSQLQDIESLLDDIDQAYLDTIDDVQDNFDKQIDDYEYVADLIEHDIDLLELLYGEKNYNAMNQYYTTLERNQTNQLDALRKQAEFWQKQWQDAAALGDTEAAKKFEENYRQALDNLNSVIEQAAETIQNKYINAIDNIFDRLDKKISGGLGTDYLDMQWQLMNKNAETYLDTINAAFAVQDLQRKYTKAINETQSIRNQQTLKKLMDEQLDNLREKEKISQYDVDRAEKMLQIEQARIALEDAQSSKTSLRLKRDAQGNYSYQYVSDADKVTEAQEKLAEAQNDLYNFDKQAYKSNLDEMLAAWQEFQDKYKQIVLDTSLTEEERIARLTELRENYATFINDKTAQNLDIRQNLIESAFMNIDKVYQQDVKNYQQMTAQQKEILMGELVPMWNSGIQQMSDKVAGDGGFIPACQDAFDRITEATKNYRDELDAMAQVAGVDLLSVRMGVDDLVFSFENLIMDNDELLGRMFEELTTIQSLRMQAQALMMQYRGVYESALAAASAIHEFIQAQRAQAAAEAEMAAQAQAQAQQAQAVAASSSGGGTQSSGNSGDYLIQQTKVKSTDGSGTLTIEEKIYPVGGSSGGGGKKGKAAKFDSGGYTGDWDTSDGKFAILHEKELVLNQSDTQNLLNSVQILRDLATNAQLGMSSRLSDVEVFRSAVFNGDKDTIEQNVQITATFPNVNSKQQIEDAFNDLINLAAQRAMRNN